MTLTEKIIQHIENLPESSRLEVLDFVQYLEIKNQKRGDDTEWSSFSIFNAMRGMEDEPDIYTPDDIKEKL